MLTKCRVFVTFSSVGYQMLRSYSLGRLAWVVVFWSGDSPSPPTEVKTICTMFNKVKTTVYTTSNINENNSILHVQKNWKHSTARHKSSVRWTCSLGAAESGIKTTPRPIQVRGINMKPRPTEVRAINTTSQGRRLQHDTTTNRGQWRRHDNRGDIEL